MNNLNEKLKYCLLGIYKKFVDEVDPKTILDFLIEKRVVTIEEREKIITCGTRQDKCRTMLDKFFTTSNPSAFVLLKEALQEHYSWLALELDEGSKQIQIEHQESHPLYERQLSTFSTKVTIDQPIFQELKNKIKDLENQLKSKNEETQKLKNHIVILENQIKTAASSIFKSEDVLADRENSINSDAVDGIPVYTSEQEMYQNRGSSEDIQMRNEIKIIESNELHDLKKLPKYCHSTYDLWKGHLECPPKAVCMKELLDINQDIEHFPEVNLLRGLKHSRIANLLGRSPHDSSKIFIVLESSVLPNVLIFLKKSGLFRISNETITEWIVQLACGLEYLHDNRILHRSIFASNLIVCNSGYSIKITNFQNAATLGMRNYILESKPLSGAERTAPEIIDRNKWSSATDIWSFGLTALKIWIRGRKIFPEMTQKDIIQFLSNAQEYSIISFLNKHLMNYPVFKNTIERCLSLEECKRPHMAELSTFTQYMPQENDDTFAKKYKSEHMIPCKKPVQGLASLSGILYAIFMYSSSIKRYDMQKNFDQLKSIRLGPSTKSKLKTYFKNKDLVTREKIGTLKPIKVCSNKLKSIASSTSMQCLYALDVGQSLVIQINVQRQKITRSWKVPEEAISLSITYKNTILIGCCSSEYIALEYDSEGNKLSCLKCGSITEGPWKAFKVDEMHCLVLHGSIYSTSPQELCMLDNDGFMSSGFGAAPFDKVSDVAVHSPSGRILIADAGGNKIMRVDRFIRSAPIEILNVSDGITAPSSIYILENLLFVGLTSGNIYCFEF